MERDRGKEREQGECQGASSSPVTSIAHREESGAHVHVQSAPSYSKQQAARLPAVTSLHSDVWPRPSILSSIPPTAAGPHPGEATALLIAFVFWRGCFDYIYILIMSEEPHLQREEKLQSYC